MNLIAVFIALLAGITGALGAMYLKKGASTYSISLQGILKNKHLILGMLFYLFSLIIFIFALSLEKVSLLYPIVATSHIWVCLLSVFILKEPINYLKWTG